VRKTSVVAVGLHVFEAIDEQDRVVKERFQFLLDFILGELIGQVEIVSVGEIYQGSR